MGLFSEFRHLRESIEAQSTSKILYREYEPTRMEVRHHRFEHIRSVVTERGLLYPIDVLLVGSTGAGKSSTLNAIFGDDVSKVGDGVDPETQQISAFKVHDYLRIHDSAGLGDSLQADADHARAIRETLQARCAVPQDNYAFIDLVLVILDGASRDLGTTFRLLESSVVRAIPSNRIVVAINQADMAMKGRYWNRARCCPEPELAEFLAEKVASVRQRIGKSTGCSIAPPICYSARYGWNLESLVDHIVQHIPESRRLLS